MESNLLNKQLMEIKYLMILFVIGMNIYSLLLLYYNLLGF